VKRVQISLIALLAVVGLIAVDLAFVRTAFADNPHLTIGLSLIGVVLQLGMLVMLFGPPRIRAFCAGFVTAGALGASSFVIFRMCPESWVALAWSSYANLVEYCIKHIPLLCHAVRGDWNDPLFAGVIAVFAFLPQLLAAVAGGTATCMFNRAVNGSQHGQHELA
jgi:hypothetical protein